MGMPTCLFKILSCGENPDHTCEHRVRICRQEPWKAAYRIIRGAEFATLLVRISLVKMGHIFFTPELLDQNLLFKNVSCFLVDNLFWVTQVQHSKINMPGLI